MFDTLSDRLQAVFKQLRGKGRLTDTDVDEALRQVRIALLEADVNFRVVKDFLGRVRARAVGADVLESLTPAQVVIKIVHEELIATLGEPAKINLSASPAVIMLVGLQGSGKTTTAAKLALHPSRRPATAPCWWPPTSAARRHRAARHPGQAAGRAGPRGGQHAPRRRTSAAMPSSAPRTRPTTW